MPKLWTTAHGHLLQMGGFRLCATARENFFWAGSIDIGRRNDFPEEVEEQHHLHTYVSDVRRQYESLDERIGWYLAEKAILGTVIEESDFYRREAPSELGITQFYGYDTYPQEDSDELIWEGALRFKAFKRLLAEGLIQLPPITADEIDDRSKGDALSKGLALLQLTWFVVQISTRAARGLAISELELTTAVLAGMNSVMYFFWWSKPRDVRFPVVIRTKGVEKLLAERPVDTVNWTFSDDEFDFRKHLWASVKETVRPACSSIVSFPHIIISAFLMLLPGIKAVPRHIKAVIVGLLESLRGKKKGTGLDSPAVPLTDDPRTSVKDPDVQEGRQASTPTSSSGCFSHKLKNVAMSLLEYAALLFCLLMYLVDLALFIPITKILGDNDIRSLSDILSSKFSTYETFEMMFYSEYAQATALLGTSSIAGALFRAVHCFAWHFSFPSHAETIMWRSASLGVAGSCVLSFVGVFTWDTYYKGGGPFFGLEIVLYFVVSLAYFFFLFLLPFVYPIARVTLLVLALTSLRSLPSSAFDTVDWVELVPHI